MLLRTDSAESHSENLRGATFMAAAMFGFAINDLIIKSFSDALGLGQTIFIRGMFATCLIFLLSYWYGQLHAVGRALSPLVAMRATAEAAATFCFLTALFHMQIAEVSAIMQALPLTVTIGAAFFLREQVGWRRLTAILVGFAGVLLIVKPGYSEFTIFSIYALAAVAACTVRDLATRRLAGDVPSLFVTLVTTVLVTLLGFGLAIWEGWQPVGAGQVSLLALASIFVLIGYFFAVTAMRVGEIGFVSPFRYLILLFSAAGGLLYYGETPDIYTVIGSVIVVSTGIYTIYRERIARRQVINPAPTRQ